MRLRPHAPLPVRLVMLSLLMVAGATIARGQDRDASDGGNDRPHSTWVYPGPDDRLVYKTDNQGNRIPDFSNCGYGGGGVALPEVPVRATVRPGPGDDGRRIQNAIDRVGRMPRDGAGFRGAVLLEAGTYEVEGTLHLNRSGVVLRGQGQGEDGTIILATGTEQRTVIEVGAADGDRREVPNTRRAITDDYVPVGAHTVHIESPHRFSVGDTVIVHRPSTAEWIAEIGMDDIPQRPDGLPIHQWQAGKFDHYYDRVITAVDGDAITLDAPIVDALDARYGGGSVYRYSFPQRISHVGVENMRGVSEFAGQPQDDDEAHAWLFISFDRCENGWARDITSRHFGFGLAAVQRRAKWITIQDARCLDPVSIIRGSRRYPFYFYGQLSLIQRAYANDARHDFAVSSTVSGPNVYLDCYAEGSHADSGPHHRWATATLYDNVHVPDHSIRVQNRLRFGSGHGWAGANFVLWNCTADHFIMQNPPTAQNWIIGSVGEKAPPTFTEANTDPRHLTGSDAHWDSHNQPVAPRSLYLAQLRDRLGDQAVDNITTDNQTTAARPR